ncbi:MAG: PDZ domain-containing protein [Saprospirales bacterium]|nr:PDZ domain-containing protein [Saprospirales bacterium]
MLEELDPHSVYLPPLEMSHEAEMMDGNFEGIGIEFMIINDTISVVTPISGGPSEQAGIGAGDKIILIDDTVATGKKITNEFVMKKLKGPKDTKVKVTMLKNGTKKLVTYTIKRNKIPIYSVDAGFMLDNEVGYIKVNRFAKKYLPEFMENWM